MAFTETEFQALQELLREEIRSQMVPLKTGLDEFRNETQDSFDKLFLRLESVEQEYESVKGQLKRIESNPSLN